MYFNGYCPDPLGFLVFRLRLLKDQGEIKETQSSRISVGIVQIVLHSVFQILKNLAKIAQGKIWMEKGEAFDQQWDTTAD